MKLKDVKETSTKYLWPINPNDNRWRVIVCILFRKKDAYWYKG